MPEVMQELQEVRTLAREFAQTELRPHVEHWDHERAIGAATFAQVAELGFLGMLIPDAYGGMGFDLPAYVAVLEQLAWGEAGVALTVAHTTIAAHLIQQYGNDTQKQRWLEPLSRGELLPCLAFAESDPGLDPENLTTRAVRSGDEWMLNGLKAWVINAPNAQLALVLAGTDDGLALFAVPKDNGWQAGPRSQTLGLRVLPITEMLFTDVRISRNELLASVGPDAAGSLSGELGWVSVAAIAVGIAQAALDHALAYAAEREQFGRKLREFEGLQFKLADMATRTHAARALLQRAASEGGMLPAMAKVFASETAVWVTTNAVQVFGGYGYMRDYPVEKLMRDAKAMELLEGANELLRVHLARELYR